VGLGGGGRRSRFCAWCVRLLRVDPACAHCFCCALTCACALACMMACVEPVLRRPRAVARDVASRVCVCSRRLELKEIIEEAAGEEYKDE
jgi:hypothetical protein